MVIIMVLLYIIRHFSMAAFKIFLFSLYLSSLTLMYIDKIFSVFFSCLGFTELL